MPMPKLTIAIAQMAIAFGQPADNRAKVKKFVAQAAKQRADIVVFPELWDTGYDLTRFDEIADSEGTTAQQLLAQLAQQYHIYILGGSVAVSHDGHFYNTTYVFDDQGQLLSTYRKVHLFGLMHEDQYLQAGNQMSHFTVKTVPATNVICYDIRFPEWLRKLSAAGSELIFVPAEWPEQRTQQWLQLLAARAIENQSFVIGVNRVGDDPDNHFAGHSVVYDPLGNVLSELGDTEALKTVTIDLDQITSVRGEIPVFADRRPDLY
ncbi:carbon-nitrogen family hydrolase [Agrilactobacillus fermenti]|uniref:carbon-nitrogen family hydrolase n=1 Tax=Agrilactobacillus fermenti TaxID=2586909 RepID=UPI003A5C0F6D